MAFNIKLRVLEDAVVVAGSAVAAWKTGGSLTEVVSVVSGAPVVRSALATLLSGGRSSGLLEALSLVRQALGSLNPQPAGKAVNAEASPPPVLDAPAAP